MSGPKYRLPAPYRNAGKNTWHAELRHQGQRVRLGSFRTREEAADAIETWLVEAGAWPPPTDADRFWVRVTEAPTGCWLWDAEKNLRGYGSFSVNGQKVHAHRWAYESMVAPIPAGLHLDHLCRVTTCVNPWHLDPVTPRVNTLRGVNHVARFAVATACIHGHSFDEANTSYTRAGGRVCKTCQRERARRRYAAGKASP